MHLEGSWHVRINACVVTACSSILQDKLLVRVKTANAETEHLKDFDYGEPHLSSLTKSCACLLKQVLSCQACVTAANYT